MITQLKTMSINENNLDYHLPQIYRSTLKKFKQIAQSVVRFHCFFLSLIFLELSFLVSYFTLSNNLNITAFIISGLFLTGFSYFILLFYNQTKKNEQFFELKVQFIEACNHHLPHSNGQNENHLPIANALFKLANYLEHFESNFYQISPQFQWLQSIISSFSIFFYKNDVFKIKIIFLRAAIEEHLEQIRIAPTDLEVHASLANLYVSLSHLYQEHQIPKLFQITAKLAVEEFQILSQYAPNDPWVHEQLASGFANLDMIQEELREVENLVKLKPQDQEVLFRLGILYFNQGLNAKGLQIYETLKKSSFPKAENLIQSYTQSHTF